MQIGSRNSSPIGNGNNGKDSKNEISSGGDGDGDSNEKDDNSRDIGEDNGNDNDNETDDETMVSAQEYIEGSNQVNTLAKLEEIKNLVDISANNTNSDVDMKNSSYGNVSTNGNDNDNDNDGAKVEGEREEEGNDDDDSDEGITRPLTERMKVKAIVGTVRRHNFEYVSPSESEKENSPMGVDEDECTKLIKSLLGDDCSDSKNKIKKEKGNGKGKDEADDEEEEKKIEKQDKEEEEEEEPTGMMTRAMKRKQMNKKMRGMKANAFPDIQSVIGLQNMGNTCFMVYCLYFLFCVLFFVFGMQCARMVTLTIRSWLFIYFFFIFFILLLFLSLLFCFGLLCLMLNIVIYKNVVDCLAFVCQEFKFTSIDAYK